MRNFQLYRIIRENIKIFKIEKMAAVFLKILKMNFLEKATLKFLLFFFGGLSIIWTTYFSSFASGKEFLPIKKKNIFRIKIKIVNFFKNYRKKE